MLTFAVEIKHQCIMDKETIQALLTKEVESYKSLLETKDNDWTEEDKHALFEALSQTRAKFILSTWHHNDYRANDMLNRYWNNFNITTREHFYHGGGHIENRHAMVEALVFNLDLSEQIEAEPARQLELFAVAI